MRSRPQVHRTGRFLVEITDRHAQVVQLTDPAGVVCACGLHPTIRAKLSEWAELLELLERLKRERLQ